MKALFLVLSLCLGFSVAVALDGTLQIQSVVKHPQTGQETTINLGTHTFDVFRDRRELIREVYNICKNPPAKIKTFIANRKNLGDSWVRIHFNNPSSRYMGKAILDCEYDKGKLYNVGKTRIYNDTTLDDRVDDIVSDKYFSDRFAEFIDTARADAKAKDINVSVPNKSVTIKFGTQVIDDTGAEGIATYPSLDYKFNVYEDRRELVKKVWESCAKLEGNMLDEIKNGNKNPSMSVWYEHPNGGLDELKSLKCRFSSRTGELDSLHGSIWANSAEEVSKKAAKNEYVSDDYMKLIDAANAGTKKSTAKKNAKK